MASAIRTSPRLTVSGCIITAMQLTRSRYARLSPSSLFSYRKLHLISTLDEKPMYKESNHVVEPLIDALSEHEDTTSNQPQSRWKSSYRTTVSLGAALAIAVLSVNAGVLVWARFKFTTDPDGIVTVYEGA
jgi:hypothetical protein